MIKTFIYGDPHGFDFYEKDVYLNDYFKGFYISSRRGRRLVVNRRENGETIYSYLQYNLKEVIARPTHAFFGMSLVLTDNEYCPDFKTLLDFFDTIFNKIVSEKNIFTKNDDGSISYCIHKFVNAEDDVRWIKEFLPKIITEFSKTHVERYDDSFKSVNAGQVVHFNNPISEAIFLQKLREYRWVSISSMFDNNYVQDTADELELNYFDLKGNLDKSNASIVELISSGNSSLLSEIETNVSNISSAIKEYLTRISKGEDHKDEVEKISELDESYKSLLKQIESIKLKLTSGGAGKVQLQHCYCCAQDKTADHFRSLTSTKCIECEQAEADIADVGLSYKMCEKCGMNKPLSDFTDPSDTICTDCKSQENHEGTTLGELLEKYKKYLFGSIAVIAGIVCVYFAVSSLRSCEFDHGKSANNPSTSTVNTTGSRGQHVDNVDETAFNACIQNKDVKGAYKLTVGKENAEKYKKALKTALLDMVWDIAENEGSTKNDKLTIIAESKIQLGDVIEFVGWSSASFDKISKVLVDDIIKMIEVMSKLEITEQEYQTAVGIIDKYPQKLDANIKSTLKSKIKKAPVVTEPTDPKAAPGPISITYTKPDGTQDKLTKNGHCKVVVKAGTLVSISYPNGVIKVGGKPVRRTSEYSDTYSKNGMVYCGKFGVTIEVKQSQPSFNE